VIEIDTQTVAAGDYGAVVRLKTASGSSLTMVGKKTLSAGAGFIPVEFDAESILSLNENGPYQIERVDLQRYTPESVMTVDRRDNLGSTQAYSLTEIQHPAIYFTGNTTITGIDADLNGKYEGLEISTEVAASTQGYYQILGDLVDSNGKTIEKFNGEMNIS